jgi:hypothetical protein
MHTYLDSRDLITLAERRSTDETARFDDQLRHGGHELIFGMDNILEICTPLIRVGSRCSVMRTLNRLERLPHVYVADARIEALELEEAARAFLGRAGIQTHILADCPTFDYVVSAFESGPPTKMFLRYELAQVIFELWRIDKGLFMEYPHHAKRLRSVIESDTKRVSRQRHHLNFRNKISKYFRLHDIDFSVNRTGDLSEWICEDTTRCPALKLVYEVFHKIVRNLTDRIPDSDIPDFSHISCISYVDAITLTKGCVDMWLKWIRA